MGGEKFFFSFFFVAEKRGPVRRTNPLPPQFGFQLLEAGHKKKRNFGKDGCRIRTKKLS